MVIVCDFDLHAPPVYLPAPRTHGTFNVINHMAGNDLDVISIMLDADFHMTVSVMVSASGGVDGPHYAQYILEQISSAIMIYTLYLAISLWHSV